MDDKPLKGKSQRATQSASDTICFTREEAESWELPAFQRPLSVNEKVRSLAARIAADGGVLPGTLTFAIVEEKKYLLDGQHRRHAFLLSGKAAGYADARFKHFPDLAAAAEEFVELNSHLVTLRPDDILRGLEPSLPALALIREGAPFVGYGMIRRKESAPILSMSCLLRCWAASAMDVPNCSSSAASLARALTPQEAQLIIEFLGIAMKAWGRDPEYLRLWGAVNLTLCMWLYRRIVLGVYSSKVGRFTVEEFTRGLMGLSADPDYCDWLVGRCLGERDRSPAYARIKAIFGRRLRDGNAKVVLPAPAWCANSGGHPYQRKMPE